MATDTADEELLIPQRMFDPAELRPHPLNAKLHNEAWLRDSIGTIGLVSPIVVNLGSKTGRPLEILSGHGTLAAWKAERPGRRVQASVLDVDEDTGRRVLLNMNPGAHDPGFDEARLAELLAALGDDYAGVDYSAADLDEMLGRLGIDDPGDGPGPIIDPDLVDEVPVNVPSVTRPGDLWRLGGHRVLCGDATDPAAYDAVLGDAVVSCVWTDPPYGVDYVGGTEKKLTIRGDSARGLPVLLASAFRRIIAACPGGCPVYVASPSGPGSAMFSAAFGAAGLRWRQTLVWVKNALVLGRSDYHYQHEPILHGDTPPDAAAEVADILAAAAPGEGYESGDEQVLYGFTAGGQGRLGRGGPRWYGDNRQTSVFQVPKPRASLEHPTMKPVLLVEAMLRNSSPRGGHVLDPFGGSGSTLIAANQRGATAHLIEIDPHYVDVICARWRTATGLAATRGDDDEPFPELPS